MTRFVRHVIIPGVAPVLFLAIALTPVAVFGCRARGLLALAVSLLSGLAAVGVALRGVRARLRGQEESPWWLVTTLLLTIPVVALLVLA
ncbi:MAG: hypothetical protein AB9873_02615 [Syntrophobacteraceae bacterium]